MTALRAIVLVACGAGLSVGCEAIDDFSPFHVVAGDGGALFDAAVPDLAPDGGAGGDLSLPSPTPDLAAPDLAPCGMCSPGDQRMIPCGNCGMETDTCTKGCQWSAGACNGQGCAPGSTQAGGCDQCSQQTCGNDCKWSACALKPGNACEYKGGKNLKPCNCPGWGSDYIVINGCDGITRVVCYLKDVGQQCLARCQWDPSGCSCPNDVPLNMPPCSGRVAGVGCWPNP